MKRSIKLLSALTLAMAGAGQAGAATYGATADTSVYEFLGNLSGMGVQDVLVFNHESNHGTRAVLDFNTLDSALPTLTAGSYTATLNVYANCVPSGFVAACPGYPDAGSPGGVATLTTDIFTQLGAWSENGVTTWANLVEGTKFGSFTVNSANPGWISIDITSLVQYWAGIGSTGDGIVLSQEAYPVVRTDANALPVLQLGGREGAYGAYIDVQAVPVPAAAWLFGSALLGMGGISRRRKNTAA